MLKGLLQKAVDAFKRIVAQSIRQAHPDFRRVKSLPLSEQGKLENRFHYARPIGGFRLRPSGKHHRGWAPYHGKPKSRLGAII